MTVVSKRVGIPFLLALVGVVVMVAVVLVALVGPLVLVPYAGLLLGPLVAAGLSARKRRARLASGRTCTCCTASVHDPVQVI